MASPWKHDALCKKPDYKGHLLYEPTDTKVSGQANPQTQKTHWWLTRLGEWGGTTYSSRTSRASGLLTPHVCSQVPCWTFRWHNQVTLRGLGGVRVGMQRQKSLILSLSCFCARCFTDSVSLAPPNSMKKWKLWEIQWFSHSSKASALARGKTGNQSHTRWYYGSLSCLPYLHALSPCQAMGTPVLVL